MTDYRGDVIGKLELANVNTVDGDFGFLIGTDGIFTDVNGKKWYGSQLIQVPKLDYSINGTAPSGEITLSFFQDPSAPDLIQQIRDLGKDYVVDRDISFYTQPITSHEDLYAPKLEPILILRRRIRSIVYSAQGSQNRVIGLTFESIMERRRAMRRFIYNTVDHSRYVGSPNPSLQFIPTLDFEEEKLFG